MITITKKSIRIIVGIFLLIISMLFLFFRDNKTVEIVPEEKTLENRSQFFIEGGKVPVYVEIADSEEERTQGLSGREALSPYTGKLFIFEHTGMYGFWMKDMRFPIDIVWIDESFRVVAITPSVSPDTFPDVFYPPTPIQFVLEINAGESESLGFSPGVQLKLLR